MILLTLPLERYRLSYEEETRKSGDRFQDVVEEETSLEVYLTIILGHKSISEFIFWFFAYPLCYNICG